MIRKYSLPMIAILSILSVQAQDLDTLFAWKVSLAQPLTAQGASGYIDLTLKVETDHIVYREMTSFEVDGPEWIETAAPLFPKPEIKTDPTDGEKKPVYHDTVRFRIPYSIAYNAPLGTAELSVTVNYQGCSQELCYFPQSKKHTLSLEITEGTGRAPGPAVQQETSDDVFFAKGYFLTFLTVFFFGFLTCLTPCVYPLISITITIFGARETKNIFHAFTLASTYVLGIAFMYSSLGYMAAVTGAVFGQFMSNPWVMSGVAIFFAAMGCSMLGAFEFRLPSSWQNGLSAAGGKGYPSAFLMGLAAGIVAAPCTGPILAGILTYTATQGSPTLGLSLLFVYSLGLGLPFLVLGTFSGMISHLPKSGGWMEWVKSVFGIILFVCALYFLKNTFDWLRIPIELSVWIYSLAIAAFLLGIFLGAAHLSYHTPNFIVRFRKTAGIVLCVLAVYSIAGSEPPKRENQVDWVFNLEEGLASAKEQGKPVMIDFYADWCAVCKEIDYYTYTSPAVGDALDRFINIKLDLSDSTEANAGIQRQYGITGLPVVVFYDSQGAGMPSKRIARFIEPEEFVDHVENIQ